MNKLIIREPYLSKTSLAIEKYLKADRRDSVIAFTSLQTNLLTAINVAVESKDENCKLHNHQHRIKNGVLREFSEVIALNQSRIKDAITFDEIYNIIYSLKVKGIGHLTVYDITLRVCVFRNIEPLFVYIHSGAKKGLKALTGVDVNSVKIESKDFVPNLSGLTNKQIEDFLCHYHCFYSDL